MYEVVVVLPRTPQFRHIYTTNVKDPNEKVFKSIYNDHNYCVKDSIGFKNNEFESNPSNIRIIRNRSNYSQLYDSLISNLLNK
jgi:hypothetical protein